MRMFPFLLPHNGISVQQLQGRGRWIVSKCSQKTTGALAKSSSWQGEIHSSCAALFSEIPIQRPGGLLLCESATAKALQNKGSPKWDSSEATLIQEGFGSLHRKALKETLQSEKFFEDVCVQKLCLFWSVSAGSCQIITGNSTNLAFSCCDATRSRNPWVCFVGNTRTDTQKLREKIQNRNSGGVWSLLFLPILCGFGSAQNWDKSNLVRSEHCSLRKVSPQDLQE